MWDIMVIVESAARVARRAASPSTQARQRGRPSTITLRCAKVGIGWLFLLLIILILLIFIPYGLNHPSGIKITSKIKIKKRN